MQNDEINKRTRRTELSDFAKSDIEEIWLYLSEINQASADKLIKEMLQKFRMLAENPKLGKSRDEILLELRSFPFKKYIIFYLLTDYGIEIFRIVHSARNIEGLFDELFEGLKE